MRDWGCGTPSRVRRAEIDQALAHGVTLRDVEQEIIERAGLSEDARAALWLYAWGASERRQERSSSRRPLVAATWGRDGCGD